MNRWYEHPVDDSLVAFRGIRNGLALAAVWWLVVLVMVAVWRWWA